MADQPKVSDVLSELLELGIRYPSEHGSAPQNDVEAIEEERRALEIRYAPVLNRKPGECPTRPTLRVIEGGKPAGDDRAED